MGQDWHMLFPSEKDPLKIDTMDLDGIQLASIKALSNKVKEHAKRIEQLEE